MFEQGNTNIILPDMELQQCFQTHIIYTPNIPEYCKQHVNPVPNEKSQNLLHVQYIIIYYNLLELFTELQYRVNICFRVTKF